MLEREKVPKKYRGLMKSWSKIKRKSDFSVGRRVDNDGDKEASRR